MAEFKASYTVFHAASDLVVTGSNPENADISNPTGAIYGESWYIVAENTNGDRRVSPSLGLNEHGSIVADKQAAALNERAKSGRLPVGFAFWQDSRPAYGSNAYVQYGQADDVALERMEG